MTLKIRICVIDLSLMKYGICIFQRMAKYTVVAAYGINLVVVCLERIKSFDMKIFHHIFDTFGIRILLQR